MDPRRFGLVIAIAAAAAVSLFGCGPSAVYMDEPPASAQDLFPSKARAALGSRVAEARAETPTTNFVATVRLSRGKPEPVDTFKLLDAMASLVETDMPFVVTIRYRSKDATSFETAYWNPSAEPAYASLGELPPRTIRSLLGMESDLAPGARVLGDVSASDRALVHAVATGGRPVPKPKLPGGR